MVQGYYRDVETNRLNRPQYYVVGACSRSITCAIAFDDCPTLMTILASNFENLVLEFGARIWCSSKRVGQNVTGRDITWNSNYRFVILVNVF